MYKRQHQTQRKHRAGRAAQRHCNAGKKKDEHIIACESAGFKYAGQQLLSVVEKDLDVYKRQEIHLGRKSKRIFSSSSAWIVRPRAGNPASNRTVMPCGVTEQAVRSNISCPQRLTDKRPVSYTHLDVYKRQAAAVPPDFWTKEEKCRRVRNSVIENEKSLSYNTNAVKKERK